MGSAALNYSTPCHLWPDTDARPFRDMLIRQ